MDWQDNLYGGALAAEFDRQHIQYFTNKVFDFFAMVSATSSRQPGLAAPA